ncbi:hypothetical protein E2C01_012749 [Portunus trituberculatus]|uniref:Uncharacterized protein n=1 Tax=Portunus trituberculatus TaxID=210409 RepID=A0A5B7DF90_PORTR|nr:hypothetical protein [Portunus trituberculatus]
MQDGRLSLAGGSEVDRWEWQHPRCKWRKNVSHRNTDVQTLQLRADSFDECLVTGLQPRQAGMRLKKGPDDLRIVTGEMGKWRHLTNNRRDAIRSIRIPRV